MSIVAGISEKHLRMLKEGSGLSDRMVAERGYYTEESFGALRGLGFSNRQALTPALVIPLHDVYGGQAGFQIRPDSPRTSNDGKVIKYESPRGSRAILDVPLRCQADLANPTKTLYITEGAKKVDALADHGLVAISLNGVWNWRGTNASGGKTALADFEVIAFNGRLVRIVFDSDVVSKQAVAAALLRLRAFLERKGAEVEIIYLPPGEAGKTGIDDFLAGGGTIEELTTFASSKVVMPSVSGLRQILVGNRQVRDIANDCWAAILEDNDKNLSTFQNSGRLVRLDKSSGIPRLLEYTESDLQYQLGRLADFIRINGRGEEVAAELPSNVAKELLIDWEKPVPPLKEIVTTPIVDRTGVISMEPGYDARSELYYLHRGVPSRRLPESPSRDEVEQAVALIAEWLHDFPFASDADRCHAIAVPLTFIIREMISGPMPLFVVDAPTPGTGKTLLVETAIQIMEGGPGSITTQPRDDEEWRKRITALLLRARGSIVIDNVKRKLESPSLAAALTGDVWEDRLLGKSQTVTVKNRAVWVATGNNVQLDLETARRAVRCHLDAQRERPWEGRGFLHGDLREWVSENREELVWAYLVLIGNWVASGKPATRGPRLGMFESWSDVVGGVLKSAGIEGFLENRGVLYVTADPESAQWNAFVETWWEQLGDERVDVDALVPLLQTDGHLSYLVDSSGRASGTHSLKIRLGKALRERADRRIGRWYMRGHGISGHKKTNAYSLERAEIEAQRGEHPAGNPTVMEEDSKLSAESAECAECETRPVPHEELANPARNLQRNGSVSGRSVESKNTPHTPHTPQQLNLLGTHDEGRPRSSTANKPQCRQCGLGMSVVALSDVCGSCQSIRQ